MWPSVSGFVPDAASWSCSTFFGLLYVGKVGNLPDRCFCCFPEWYCTEWTEQEGRLTACSLLFDRWKTQQRKYVALWYVVASSRLLHHRMCLMIGLLVVNLAVNGCASSGIAQIYVADGRPCTREWNTGNSSCPG